MFNLMKALVLWVVMAVVGAMFAVGDTYYESDGQAVNVDLTYSVTARDLVVVQSWVGVAVETGESGDTIALDISGVERQLQVPASLSVSKGATIYLEVADLTGHTPDDTAYSTSSGAGKIALMKATAAKDASNIVTGIMFPKQ